MKEKLDLFEYMVHSILEWYDNMNKEQNTQLPRRYNEFSKLKIIKLHFFACATTTDQDNEGLLDIFSEFYAMPYGHVESDIFSHITQLDSMTVERAYIELTGEKPTIDENIKRRLDTAIENLKRINPDIVTYNATKLVNLSHVWTSWKTSINIARKFNKSSIAIPNQLIMNESKYYSF